MYKHPEIGDRINGFPVGTISAIRPYTGLHTADFRWVITINCRSGAVLEMAVPHYGIECK